jgi:hypothetical protein
MNAQLSGNGCVSPDTIHFGHTRPMNIVHNDNQITLAKRAILKLSNEMGLAVRCDKGSVWITLDHDPRDIVLGAGQCFKTGEGRRALIYAFEPSLLTLISFGREQAI